MAEQSISMEEFKMIADRAGLGMDQQELEDLKPIYDPVSYTHLPLPTTPYV